MRKLNNICSSIIFSVILTYTHSYSVNPKSLKCLQNNIFFESGGESYLDKIMVANVVMNRTNSKKYPNDVCKVVYQNKQFSWTKQKNRFKLNNLLKNKLDYASWLQSREIAEMAIIRDLPDLTFNSLYYKEKNVHRIWDHKLTKTVSTKKFNFYK